jgi:hypothetical protein
MEATVFTIEETNVEDVYFKLVKYMFSVRLTLLDHKIVILIRQTTWFDTMKLSIYNVNSKVSLPKK